MSIQPVSVVRRIVEDARENPRTGFRVESFAPESLRATAPRQCITWIRAPAGGFTTEFEFWAHALHVWLEQAGLPERLEPIVGNALCEPVGEAELRRAIDARRGDSQRLELDGSFAGAYRMLAQEVVESYVILTERELLAYFWEDLAWR